MTKVSEMIEGLGIKLENLMNEDSLKKAIELKMNLRKLGYKYSNFNILLAMTQAHGRGFELSFIGSAKFFKEISDKLNLDNPEGEKVWYGVQKGEKALQILAPVVRKYKTKDENGEEVEKQYMSFRTVPVFDISQTKIKIDDILDPEKLKGDGFQSVYERVTAFVLERGYTIRELELASNLGGYIYPKDKAITLNALNDVNQKLKTLLHEFAHGELEHGLSGNHEEYDVREVEAEATAYILSHHLGMDTSSYSLKYILGWANYDVNKVRTILSSVDKKIDMILSSISLAVGESDEEAQAS